MNKQPQYTPIPQQQMESVVKPSPCSDAFDYLMEKSRILEDKIGQLEARLRPVLVPVIVPQPSACSPGEPSLDAPIVAGFKELQSISSRCHAIIDRINDNLAL